MKRRALLIGGAASVALASTARAMGFAIPQSLLVRADRVIE